MKIMFRYYNRKYIFPVQFSVCVAGNILNLIVLSGRNMRTKTNCFLTAMAVADLLFFLAMLLPNLDYVGGGAGKSHQYYFLHIPFVAFANWFSAVSIWLTVAVTVERLIATTPHRVPSVCRSWDKRRTFVLIAAIYMLAFMLSLYHYAWRKVRRRIYNVTGNGTNISYQMYPYTWDMVGENEPIAYWYVQSSHLLSNLLVVVGPLLVLFVLNCVIVYRLRSHNRHFSESLVTASEASGSVLERIRRRERRVTLTIVLLVTVFIICALPSGLFSILEFLGSNYVKVIFLKPWFWELGETCNALVCTGKAVNFWLYCGASSDYRKELRHVLTCRRCRYSDGAVSKEWDRSRSTSRVSNTWSALRYRRSVISNRQMSEVYSNGRVASESLL